MKNENQGITLIALVITIIVLLILAGVTIGTLTGSNGIFSKSEQVKEKYELSKGEENITLILAEWQIEKYSDSNKTLEDFLQEKGVNYEGPEDKQYEIEKDGYMAIINLDGQLVGNVEKARLRPQVSNIKITTDGTIVPEDNSLEDGVQLQINFDSAIENGQITQITPSLPYTTDGTEKKVNFIIVGKVDGIEYTRKKTIVVENKYKKVDPRWGEYLRELGIDTSLYSDWNSAISDICTNADKFQLVANNEKLMNIIVDSKTARLAMYNNYTVTESILQNSDIALNAMLENSEIKTCYNSGHSIKIYDGKAFVLGVSASDCTCIGYTNLVPDYLNVGTFVRGDTTIKIKRDGNNNYTSTWLGTDGLKRRINKFTSTVDVWFQQSSYAPRGNIYAKIFVI